MKNDLIPKGYKPVACSNPECDMKDGQCSVENWELMVRHPEGDIKTSPMKSYFCRKCKTPIQVR